jgi:hypothetical protein
MNARATADVVTTSNRKRTSPIYKAYGKAIPTLQFPTLPSALGAGAMPKITGLPTYQATQEAYPITEFPTYEPTEEIYPGYRPPEAGEVATELQKSITERIRGAGTAGAESAIYKRGEERIQEEYEKGLKMVDEEMASRGLTGSGIHGEAINKLKEERQRSLADLSRQVTIYGQEAIESAMGRAQQYLEYQSAESARELAAKERGYVARVRENIAAYESEARAAEARGASEQAAYQTAIAERIRAYEAQARAAEAKNAASVQKWQAKQQDYLQKYQLQLEKAQLLHQAKMRAFEIGREEYTKAYESTYRASRDRYQAEQAAAAAAERKA